MKVTIAVLLTFIAVGLVGGCATDKKVIAQADATDKGLSPAEFEDPAITAYLNKIGARIIAAAKIADSQHYEPHECKTHYVKGQSNDWMFTSQIQFHLVNSKTLNAFTTGGHHVYIYGALFQLCQNEDELAAVMAHEYGHIYCRHVAKGMDRQYGIFAAEAAAGAGGYLVGGSTDAAQTGASAGRAGGELL